MKKEKNQEKLRKKQLCLMDYVERRLLRYTVAGGWAVDGILGKVTRKHGNVDFMIHEIDVENFKRILRRYDSGMEVKETGRSMMNIHAECGDLVADAIVMTPVVYGSAKKDYVIFETPYHSPFAPIPKDFLYGVSVELDGVDFCALNPTAMYFSKLASGNGTKAEIARDQADARKLARFVDAKLRKKMRRYA
ncbi:MAG: hypothetical protein QXD77_02795 [Candidatus Aenigmatarchaeota archaeon]